MKAIILAISFFISRAGIAQIFDKPDYHKIESAVGEKNSESVYAKLLVRFNLADSSLQKEDFRNLYYGFFFQKNYSAFGHNEYIDSLKPILAKKEYQKEDYDKMIYFEGFILKDEPFSLRNLNILGYAHRKKNEDSLYRIVLFKINNIVSTVLSTGDGKTESTGWHVISVADEYELLNMLGFEFGGKQSLTAKGCDYLAVKQNRSGLSGVYFDANMILQKEQEIFKGK
jgi:hypothetical protein